MNANLCAGAIWTWREGVSCSTHWGSEPESVSAHSVGSSAWWAYTVENALSIIRWNVSVKIKEMFVLVAVCVKSLHGCGIRTPQSYFLDSSVKKNTKNIVSLHMHAGGKWLVISRETSARKYLRLGRSESDWTLIKWPLDDTKGAVISLFFSVAAMNEHPKDLGVTTDIKPNSVAWH